REKEEKMPALLYKGHGCSFCSYTGYRGRIALAEVFTLTNELKELVMARASSDELRKVAYQQGMTGLKGDALNKIYQGVTTVGEVMRVTFHEGE
ncbi:MAG TPA: type II secretion system protein GspE, partial [Desulfotomaculum sp.]|nr:type II secretion system protein GspE [Desulfotomaculum sp.]